MKPLDSVGKKIKLTARGFAAAVSFIFFPDRFWRFHNFMPLKIMKPSASFIFDAKIIRKQNRQFHKVFTWNFGTIKNKNKDGFCWNPTYGEFWPKNSFFRTLKPDHKKKIPPKWVRKKNTTFGFKKSAETWTWNHFGFQKNWLKVKITKVYKNLLTKKDTSLNQRRDPSLIERRVFFLKKSQNMNI